MLFALATGSTIAVSSGISAVLAGGASFAAIKLHNKKYHPMTEEQKVELEKAKADKKEERKAKKAEIKSRKAEKATATVVESGETVNAEVISPEPVTV